MVPNAQWELPLLQPTEMQLIKSTKLLAGINEIRGGAKQQDPVYAIAWRMNQ